MIEVAQLHKRFGEVVAVDDVSFTAADGTVTGLLGPNGAGKTTTLRMLYTHAQRGWPRFLGSGRATGRGEVRLRASGVTPTSVPGPGGGGKPSP